MLRKKERFAAKTLRNKVFTKKNINFVKILCLCALVAKFFHVDCVTSVTKQNFRKIAISVFASPKVFTGKKQT